MDEMEPMAWNATLDQIMGRPSRNASAVIAHTALLGVWVRGFRAPRLYTAGRPRRGRSSTASCKRAHHGNDCCTPECWPCPTAARWT